MTWAAVGTALGSAALLGVLVPFAVGGVIGTRHPFDAIYERVIRPRLGTPSIPRYGVPRRFACAVAAVWLTATAISFHVGAGALGYALGAALVLAAAVPTFTGFCIPSWIYARLRRQPRPAGAGERTLVP